MRLNVNHLATQVHVNSVINFSSYFPEKTQCLHYNDQSVDAVVGITAVYSTKRTKLYTVHSPTNALFTKLGKFKFT